MFMSWGTVLTVHSSYYSTVSPTAAQYWLSRWERAVWAWRNDNWQLDTRREYRTCRLELPSVTNCCTKFLAHEHDKLQVTYSKKWYHNMTVFWPENDGSRYIPYRLHGVISQHVATFKLKVMRKRNLTCSTAALYICIFLVPRGFENRTPSVKHSAIYACINLLKPTSYVMNQQVEHSTIVRSAYIVFLWEQTATCATYSRNWLIFIIEMQSVYCAVWTGTLNKAVCHSSLRG
jgi:hypothetical protein